MPSTLCASVATQIMMPVSETLCAAVSKTRLEPRVGGQSI